MKIRIIRLRNIRIRRTQSISNIAKISLLCTFRNSLRNFLLFFLPKLFLSLLNSKNIISSKPNLINQILSYNLNRSFVLKSTFQRRITLSTNNINTFRFSTQRKKVAISFCTIFIILITNKSSLPISTIRQRRKNLSLEIQLQISSNNLRKQTILRNIHIKNNNFTRFDDILKTKKIQFILVRRKCRKNIIIRNKSISNTSNLRNQNSLSPRIQSLKFLLKKIQTLIKFINLFIV